MTLWQWLKKIIGIKPPPSRRPSEIAVDQRALDLVTLGNKMFTTTDLDGARDAYESALRMDGHCAEAWHRLGRLYQQQGETFGALACYARSLELDPRNGDTWCGLGEAILAFQKEGKEPLFIHEYRVEIFSEAHDCFDRSLKLSGDLLRARHGREICRNFLKNSSFQLTSPRLFTFHSGGILEKAKREFVSPFLRAGDYRRKALVLAQND